MRLICPNCGAQYEVPDGVIPDAGRDVQCSNCGNTWYQHHPDNDPGLNEELYQGEDLQDLDPEMEEAPEPVATAPSGRTQRRQLDPSIAEVLREEAEREARARAAESAAPLESQPDLGLDSNMDEADRRAQQVRNRMAKMRGEPEAPRPTPAADDSTYEDLHEPDQVSRRDLLPDIDEINSSLRATNERRPAEAMDHALPGEMPKVEVQPAKGGFGRGFTLSLLVFAVLWALYAFAPQIVQRVPAAEPVLVSYVDLVDQGRGWLDAQVRNLLTQLDQTVDKG